MNSQYIRADKPIQGIGKKDKYCGTVCLLVLGYLLLIENGRRDEGLFVKGRNLQQRSGVAWKICNEVVAANPLPEKLVGD